MRFGVGVGVAPDAGVGAVADDAAVGPVALQLSRAVEFVALTLASSEGHLAGGRLQTGYLGRRLRGEDHAERCMVVIADAFQVDFHAILLAGGKLRTQVALASPRGPRRKKRAPKLPIVRLQHKVMVRTCL